MTKINFDEKFAMFTEQWSPKIVAQLNDYAFKLTRIQGDFTWHMHEHTDEAFIVLEGELRMDYRDEQVIVKQGEMIIVPKNREHKPYAEKETKILLIEPIDTLNTGDVDDEFTVRNPVHL